MEATAGNMLSEAQQQKLTEKFARLEAKYGLRFESFEQPHYTHRSTRTPLGRVLEYQFMREGQRIAHVGLIPVELVYRRAPRLGVLAAGVWVAPEHRGEGMFSALMWRTLHELQRGPYEFYCGFPNRQAFPIWVHSLGALQPSTLHFLVKPNRLAPLVRRADLRCPRLLVKGGQKLLEMRNARLARTVAHDGAVEIVADFPESVAALLATRQEPGTIFFSKTVDRLRWQFGGQRFVKFCRWGVDGDLQGYLVGAIDCKEGLQVAAILDCEIAARGVGRPEVLHSLVLAFERHFSSADLFSVLSLPHHWEYRHIRRLGYRKLNTDKHGRSFWYIFYPFRAEQFPDVGAENWYLTFYDTIDIF